MGPGFFYCRDRGRAGTEFFFIAGAGPGFNFFLLPELGFFYCRGRAGIYIFLLPGPKLDRDQKF